MMPAATTSLTGSRSVLIAALLAGCPGRALAEELATDGAEDRPECEVTLRGTRTAPWALAVAHLKQRGEGGSTPFLCQKLVIHVDARGATLEFWGFGGRSAVRSLSAPSELEPTVAALSVVPFPGLLPAAVAPPTTPSAQGDERTSTLIVPQDLAPPSPPVTALRPKPARTTYAAVNRQRLLSGEEGSRGAAAWAGGTPECPITRDPASGADVTEPRQPGLDAQEADVTTDLGATSGATASLTFSDASLSQAAFAALETGMRGGASRITTPYVEALVGLAASRAELGITARFEPWYYRLDGKNGAEPRDYGLALGVRVARRVPVAGSLLVLLGGHAQAAAVMEGGADDAGRDPTLEARVGVHTGLVARGAERMALRTTLGFEVLPHTLGSSVHGADGRPLSPWWGITLGVGGELGGA